MARGRLLVPDGFPGSTSFRISIAFIQEARALANNLHNPAAASLKSFDAISLNLKKLRSALVGEQLQLTSGTPLSQQVVQTTRSNIATLLRDVNGLSTAKPLPGQIRVPPSYVTPIRTPASRLEADYSKVTGSPTPADAAALSRSVADATSAFFAASSSYQKAVSTLVLVPDLQIWADDHDINMDFHDKFGDAVQTVSQQVNSLVSNALNIALQAGNLLLSTVLCFSSPSTGSAMARGSSDGSSPSFLRAHRAKRPISSAD
jgi:hypothetical protein